MVSLTCIKFPSNRFTHVKICKNSKCYRDSLFVFLNIISVPHLSNDNVTI